MLIEVKVKVARIIDGKTRKKTETYVLEKEFFSEAEYTVTAEISEEQSSSIVEEFNIVSMKQSAIKEIATQYEGGGAFIATLKDTYLTDDGTEKSMRYKVLLWADTLTEANARTQELAHQGYNMQVEGIKQVDYIFLPEEQNNIEREENVE